MKLDLRTQRNRRRMQLMRRRQNPKSRDNWKMPFCMKTECSNRESKCSVCVRYSEYQEREAVVC